jgi:hypothetical protein
VLKFFLLLSTIANGQTVLNLSRDLVARGIAATDLTPNSPTIDARPLLTQAITYAQQNGIGTLIADRGNYYFLSLANPQTHLQITGAANLILRIPACAAKAGFASYLARS